MDRWSGILKAPLYPKGSADCRVAASLCVSPHSRALTVPEANAIFFNGDRVEGTGNPVVERLSNIKNIADILVSKFGRSINAWVIEASTFNGPFAVYKEFIPSVNLWGEPKSYEPDGFPASTCLPALLSNFLQEVQAQNLTLEKPQSPASSFQLPKTILLGFSKGGTVINQLVTELAFSNSKSKANHPEGEFRIIPSSSDNLLNSIDQIHYVDVGLNSPGAYITDEIVVKRIAEHLVNEDRKIRFVLHGTPRQWRDTRRPWISREKEMLVELLECEGRRTEGKLQVCERMYFENDSPSFQMHFEVIERLVVS